MGVAGLSSILITSGAGLILLDGGLPQSAPAIDAHIRALGFRTEEVRLILNSHAHFDHAGGIAALQRASAATVAASASGARALQQGEPVADDPQFGFGRSANQFPVVRRVRVVKDGETLHVGELAVTARLTPGHTPGSTTWTWRSCEGARCTVEHLPCDILLSVHPEFADMKSKLARRAVNPDPNPFIDRRAAARMRHPRPQHSIDGSPKNESHLESYGQVACSWTFKAFARV